jgi:hypothetical protein
MRQPWHWWQARGHRLAGPRDLRGWLVLLAFFAILYGVAAVVPFPVHSGHVDIPVEWGQRIAVDYPGFRIVDFNMNASQQTSTGETKWRFVLVPPGRDFEVGVIYKSTDGQPAIPQDDVLRPGGRFHGRAASLLDVVQLRYAQQGRDVSISNDPAGVVTVNWVKLGWLGKSWRDGTDTLTFDEVGRSWQVSENPLPRIR